MNVIVINKRNPIETRTAQAAGYRVIYVGKGSVLANPYHGQENDRDLYRKWLWRQMQAGNPAGLVIAQMRDMVVKGKLIALECWCAPAPCHADAVKAAIDWAVSRELARKEGAAVPIVKEEVIVEVKTVKKGSRKRTETALMKKIRERDEKAANAKPKKIKALKDEERDYILSQSSIATNDEI